MDLYHNETTQFKLSRQQKVAEVQRKHSTSKSNRAIVYQSSKRNITAVP